MHLRRIELRDFKAYEAATFDFPRPEPGKNVILIGGLNGHGKTSLFEAFAAGLFGRDAVSLLARAKPGADDTERKLSFKVFIERALYGGALREGRTSCRISLHFEDPFGNPIGNPIEISRKWFFDDHGRLRIDGEQIQIFEGPSRKPVGPPGGEVNEDGWYREWIYRKFLPVNLAKFFLFDGEAAAVWAERDAGQQITDGIAGLLGLSWLRQLSKDLRDYANDRRKEMPRSGETDLVVLQNTIAALEAELDHKRKRLAEIEAVLADTELQRNQLVRDLSGYGPGTQAQLQELIQQQKDSEKAYDEAWAELEKMATSDLPLALVGTALRRRVVDRLASESLHERWRALRETGQSRVALVVEAVEAALSITSPPLDPEQRRAVREAVVGALDRLWYPPPEGAASEVRHQHAAGSMTERVRDRLDRAETVTRNHIEGILIQMGRATARIREIKRDIDAVQLLGPEIERRRENLRRLNSEIEGLNRERGELAAFIRSKEPEYRQKRGDLTRLTVMLSESQPALRRSARAEQVAQMLDELSTEAWPIHRRAIAEAMTDGIRAMAHRNDYLHHVEINDYVDINDDFEVKLCTKDGRDLREFDLSAGEKQIFTQALFRAVAEVSRRHFPVMIDTPLGRLDEDHRVNILKYLTARDGQVILLSTNTEVVGPYLEAIRSRIAKFYRLESRMKGDLRVTHPVEGYFRDEET